MSHKIETSTISVVLPTSIIHEIERLAGSNNISKTAMLRKLIYAGLKAEADLEVFNHKIMMS